MEHLNQLLNQYDDIKGVIIVNFAGRVVDSEKIKDLSERYNFWILEDACHSPGGFFTDSKGKKYFQEVVCIVIFLFFFSPS